MKRNIAILLSAVLAVSSCLPVLAAEQPQVMNEESSSTAAETENSTGSSETDPVLETENDVGSSEADNVLETENNAGSSEAGLELETENDGGSSEADPVLETENNSDNSEAEPVLENSLTQENNAEEEQPADSAEVSSPLEEDTLDNIVLPTDEQDLEIRTGSCEIDMAEAVLELGDADDLFEDYANSVFYTGMDSRLRAKKINVESRLTGKDLLIYNRIREMTAQVADGGQPSSVVQIPVTDLGIEERMYSAEELGLAGQPLIDAQTGDLSDATMSAIALMLKCDFEKIAGCLSAFCPYELYWSNGRIDSTTAFSYAYNSQGVDFSSSSLIFCVHAEESYRQNVNDSTIVDTYKTSIASNAANLAGQIVDNAAEMTDYEKLVHYKDRICDLVDYDYDAAGASGQSDRGPWALIYVFDNDPETKVVCEGYSEAFQYLGSLTDFDNDDICIYSVTGMMDGGTGEGPHKWNIVHMNDGNNYIADVTNSDSGSSGEDGKLFLTGMTGNPDDGYSKAWEAHSEQIDNGDGSVSTITYEAGSILYTYDEDTRYIYSQDELTLSGTDYDYAAVVFEIITQPDDFEAQAGDTVSFTVEAEGSDLQYQWQWSRNGTTWYDCTGAGYDTDTFSFEMQERFANRHYRCVVTSDEQTLISEAATVSLIKLNEIITQPEDAEAAVGDDVVFYVEATGSDISYQWQYSYNGTSWKDCKGAGYDTDTFGFTMQSKFDDRYYRCVVTADGETMISDAVIVNLIKLAEIVKQPVSAEAAVGENVEFRIEASGNDINYQWQYSYNGTSWRDCKSGGFDTDTFSFEMQSKFAGRYYRCVVTAGTETIISDTVIVSLVERIKIMTQPEDTTAASGNTVEFYVGAEGNNLTYQWQWSSNGTTWRNCTGNSYNSETFAFTAQSKYSGRRYRCMVTDGTVTVYSESGMLTVTE